MAAGTGALQGAPVPVLPAPFAHPSHTTTKTTPNPNNPNTINPPCPTPEKPEFLDKIV